MTPVAFAEANAVLASTAGGVDVAQLPVWRQDGILVSCWKPTQPELEEIIRTGVVWLAVWGRDTHPPALVSGHKAEVI